MTKSLQIKVDPQHGARVTSIRDSSGYDWVWNRPDPRRQDVVPGDLFVDAGGGEECFPTIAGTPDHGDVWSRPWATTGKNTWVCETPDAVIHRSHWISGDTASMRYRVAAEPGYAFVWAFHLSIDPRPGLEFDIPEGQSVSRWPAGHGSPALQESWPQVAGGNFVDLSVDDASAHFVHLPALASVRVHRPGHALDLTLRVIDQPFGFGVWRNLMGWAWDNGEQYRSIAVEPMLGNTPDKGGGGVPARVPQSGRVDWELQVVATVLGGA